jgi:membrane protease YdiL (CAAX protease family)
MKRDIDDEIEFHIDMLTRDLIAGGLSPDDARAEALRRFGDVAAVRASLVSARRRRLMTVVALVALAVTGWMQSILVLAPAYRHLYRLYPYYVPETFKNLCEVAVCIAVLLALRQRPLARALALDRRLPHALLFALVASLPTLIGFAVTRSVHVTDWISVAYLAWWSPFVEELETRGFGFLLLRRAGWPLWPAAVVCGAVTGLVHIEKGQTAASILGLFFLTGIGSVTFCWLLERWGSLWFPFALHALMNFWWELFRVAPTALGGWYAAALQNATVILAILLTLRFTPPLKRKPLQPVRQDGLGDGGELHVRRALVDLSDLRVAPVLLDRVLLRVAVAAEKLHRQ